MLFFGLFWLQFFKFRHFWAHKILIFSGFESTKIHILTIFKVPKTFLEGHLFGNMVPLFTVMRRKVSFLDTVHCGKGTFLRI